MGMVRYGLIVCCVPFSYHYTSNMLMEATVEAWNKIRARVDVANKVIIDSETKDD